MKRYQPLFALGLILAASLAGGLFGVRADSDPETGDARDTLYRRFGEVLDVIEQQAAGPVDSPDLIYSSIRQMLQRLDPHSSFFNPREYKQVQEDNSGRYFGLGIRIRALNRGSGRIVVIEPPFPGTPAFKVGLHAGDVIFRVNGESIDDWDVDDVIDKLKGPRGTTVGITVLRPGEDAPLEMEVTRDEIPKLTINYAYRIRPGIGYIKIEHFSETTGRELEEAFGRLDIDTLEGLVLDLRDNPGGYLTQAIKVSEAFLPAGAPIVSTRDRDGREEQAYKTRSAGNLKVPLVILLNIHSASASEIVSGAVQDNDRGLILGERSFGKGLVQSVFRLADGSGLALTTGKYYLPSGRSLQRPFHGSIYDYYNIRKRRKLSDIRGEPSTTLSGRVVHGGGGILPDVVFPSPRLNRIEVLLYSKDVFFKFATLAMQGRIASIPKLEGVTDATGNLRFDVGPAVLDDFRAFLNQIRTSLTDEEFEANSVFIQRGIRAELSTRLFGVLEGFKIRAEGDSQVLRALELLPEARRMLHETKALLANQGPIGRRP